jgi:hypothetical protein
MFNTKTKEAAGPVEVARDEIVGLFQMERDLTDRRREKLAAIEATSQNAAQAILDGSGIEEAAGRTIQMEAEVRAIEQAISLARRRRVVAIRKRQEIEARQLRAAAQAKRAEADAILQRCEPHLRKLTELQGVQYTAAILLAERVGHWMPDIINAKPAEDCNPHEMSRDLDGGFAVPKFLALRDEARRLDQKASQVETREIHQDYAIAKPTVQELLAAEEFQNPEALTPAVYKIGQWALALESRVLRDRPGLAWSEGNSPQRRYRLAWKAGEIDQYHSTLTFPGSDVTFALGGVE